MRFVVQRVQHSSCTIDNDVVGKINHGFMVLIGVSETDTMETADKMVKKLCQLRIFRDSEGKTNLDLASVGGELLLISQFTLYADCRKGNRPSFVHAGSPALASAIYDHIIEEARKYCSTVEHGVFGAEMKIDLMNDGPFTIILDSDDL